MKHLRQYIRQVLLTEAAYSVEDLIKEDDLHIMIRRLGSSFRIKYVSTGHDFHPTIKGNILIRPVRSSMGNCLNAYMVATVTASEGHGPLLYDIAMELATENGGGLMADRSSVSEEARAVWEYYMNNRDDDDQPHNFMGGFNGCDDHHRGEEGASGNIFNNDDRDDEFHNYNNMMNNMNSDTSFINNNNVNFEGIKFIYMLLLSTRECRLAPIHTSMAY